MMRKVFFKKVQGTRFCPNVWVKPSTGEWAALGRRMPRAKIHMNFFDFFTFMKMMLEKKLSL